MSHPLLASVSLALLTNLAHAQFFEIELTEVLVQPTAGDHQKIELGTAHIPVDTTATYICIGSTVMALPVLTLPPYSSTVIHVGVFGTSSPSHIYLPSAPSMPLAGSIALFRPGLSPGTSDLVSYIDWGGALGTHIGQAVSEGAWTNVTASAPLPAAIGSTFANRWSCRSGGNINGPDAWYDDSTPTLGDLNDPGCTVWYAQGCPGLTTPNWGIPGGWDVGPWTGEQYTIAISGAVYPALLVGSTTTTAPIDLTAIGMPGCFAHLTMEALQLLPTNGTYCYYNLAVPPTPILAGYELHLQAFVPDPTANNGLGGFVTNALRATIGSR